MTVRRLTRTALNKIVKGHVADDGFCVIKFYSNTCDLCHNFHDDYEEIARDTAFKELHFFAFNLADHPTVDYELGFEGVPTIALVEIKRHNGEPILRVCPDPPDPHPLTFLKKQYVKDFLHRHITTKNHTMEGVF